ncbi:MAG TPA: hypothetical protein V6D17_25230 [Candidatus Obscuribacterales bacterium]
MNDNHDPIPGETDACNGAHLPSANVNVLHIYHHYPAGNQPPHSVAALLPPQTQNGAVSTSENSESPITSALGTLQSLLHRVTGKDSHDACPAERANAKAGDENLNGRAINASTNAINANGRATNANAGNVNASTGAANANDRAANANEGGTSANAGNIKDEDNALAEPTDHPQGEDTSSSRSSSGMYMEGEVEAKELSSHFDWTDEDIPPPPPRRKLWQGFEGIAVMSLGVVSPILMSVLSIASCPKRITLVLLNHPIETIVEILLLLSIPFVNYRLWSALCKNDCRFTFARGLLSGISIGIAMLIAALCIAAIPAGYGELAAAVGTDFTTGFFMITALAMAAGLVGVHLINKIRLKMEFPKSRLRVVTFVLSGALIGVLMFITAETRGWCVRIAEKSAVSHIPSERLQGLEMLRKLEAQRELLMEASDARAAGIAGLFFPIKQVDMHQLYFTVTGKPFHDEKDGDLSAMSDDYLQRHVVGSAVKGLSLVRSAMDGSVNADELSATVGWTFVFRNDTQSEQEARAQVALPRGAVISGLTVWQRGEPIEARFAREDKEEGTSGWVDADHNSPAVISDLGRGRYLLHCYPIPQDEQLKISMNVVLPLGIENLDTAEIILPRFVASNFDLKGEHTLSLAGKYEMHSRAQNVKSHKTPVGQYVLDGVLDQSQIQHTPLMVLTRRNGTMQTIAAGDSFATKRAQREAKEEAERKKREQRQQEQEDMDGPGPQQVVLMIDGSKGVRQQLEDVNLVYRHKRHRAPAPKVVAKPIHKFVVRTIKEVVSRAPKRLIVVLDGSATIKNNLKDIKGSLASIAHPEPISLMVASQESSELSAPTPLREALPKLDKINFIGGQDNLKTVVKAAEAAGEAEGGVVLWIHGAQPALSRDIYIMSPFAHKPGLYELSLDSGETDCVEYFKNHGELTSFQSIQRSTNLTQDLNDFFAKWQPGRREFVVSYSLEDKLPNNCLVIKDRERKAQLLALNARKMVDEFLHERRKDKAAEIACDYQIVSPVTCVAVLANAPKLSGATNGTIGPQGTEVTYVTGVNTAGTVRVNNLANLEALLNIITNLVEMSCLITGFAAILHGTLHRKVIRQIYGLPLDATPGKRILFGIALIVAGLVTPGMVNWFVASARDANLFS